MADHEVRFSRVPCGHMKLDTSCMRTRYISFPKFLRFVVQQTQTIMFRNVSVPQGTYVLNKLCIQVGRTINNKRTITNKEAKSKECH